MIMIYLKRDSDGSIIGYKVKGHAGFDDYGKDIVCSAVSVVVQSNLLGLREVAGIDIDYSAGQGELVCMLPRGLDSENKDKARLLLGTMYLTLRNIADNYPGNISLVDEEVQ
jgi:uncharacterized protein YsxB (DUF464 family)